MDVYFVSYFVGMIIVEYDYDIENYGVIIKGWLVLIVDGVEIEYGVGDWYYVGWNVCYVVCFEEDMVEIEIWFKGF